MRRNRKTKTNYRDAALGAAAGAAIVGGTLIFRRFSTGVAHNPVWIKKDATGTLGILGEDGLTVREVPIPNPEGEQPGSMAGRLLGYTSGTTKKVNGRRFVGLNGVGDDGVIFVRAEEVTLWPQS